MATPRLRNIQASPKTQTNSKQPITIWTQTQLNKATQSQIHQQELQIATDDIWSKPF